MKKIFFILLSFMTLAGTASAQDAIRGPYATQKFGDNIFVGATAGINSLLTSANQGKLTGDFEIFAGKWFTPTLGLRIGYQGLTLKENFPGADFHEHFWMEPDADGVFKYGFSYLHGDLVWNMFNSFGGYKQRVFELLPYLHTGIEEIYNPASGMFSDQIDPEFCIGPGIIAKFNFTKHLGAVIDVRDLIFSGRFHDYNSGGVVQVVTASAGLMYSFGNTVWQRAVSYSELDEANASLLTAREALSNANAALAAALASKEALEAKAAALSAELDALRTADKDDKDVVYVKTALGVAPLILYYEIGSKELNVTERRHLDDYVNAILAQDPDRLFVLTGSADKGTGTEEINTMLSAGRAAGVQKILQSEYGVKPEHITVHSKISSDNADPRFDRSVYIEH